MMLSEYFVDAKKFLCVLQGRLALHPLGLATDAQLWGKAPTASSHGPVGDSVKVYDCTMVYSAYTGDIPNWNDGYDRKKDKEVPNLQKMFTGMRTPQPRVEWEASTVHGTQVYFSGFVFFCSDRFLPSLIFFEVWGGESAQASTVWVSSEIKARKLWRRTVKENPAPNLCPHQGVHRAQGQSNQRGATPAGTISVQWQQWATDGMGMSMLFVLYV